MKSYRQVRPTSCDMKQAFVQETTLLCVVPHGPVFRPLLFPLDVYRTVSYRDLLLNKTKFSRALLLPPH